VSYLPRHLPANPLPLPQAKNYNMILKHLIGFLAKTLFDSDKSRANIAANGTVT